MFLSDESLFGLLNVLRNEKRILNSLPMKSKAFGNQLQIVKNLENNYKKLKEFVQVSIINN